MILRYWPPDPIDRSNVNVKSKERRKRGRKERNGTERDLFYLSYENFDFINIIFE